MAAKKKSSSAKKSTSTGLTAKQKKLPIGLQKAILKKKRGK